MRGNTHLQLLLGLAIGVACLCLAFRDVPLADLGQLLAGAQYLWLIPSAAFTLIGMVVRAYRWALLLDRPKHLADSFWSLWIGALFTSVLPLRIGEPVRVAVMSQRCNMPMVQVAGATVVERLLDLAAILLLFVAVLPSVHAPQVVIDSGLAMAAVVLLGLTATIVLIRTHKLSLGLVDRLCGSVRIAPVRFLANRWLELLEGLEPLARAGTAIPATLLSIFCWLCSVLALWAVIQAFEPTGTMLEATFALITIAMAVTLPSSPGFIGVYQWAGQMALMIPFGNKYSAGIALAIALTSHLVGYVMNTSIGALGLSRLGVSFTVLRRSVSAEAQGTSRG
jgi:glycosyltransferase 2 family protein